MNVKIFLHPFSKQIQYSEIDDDIEQLPVNRMISDLEVFLNGNTGSSRVATIPRKQFKKSWKPNHVNHTMTTWAYKHKKDTTNSENDDKATLLERQPIDICSGEFYEVRQGLLEIGISASIWIEEYLLQSKYVVVSNKDDFISKIRQWKYDPCLSRNEK